MPRPTGEEVFSKDGFKCIYCGFDGETFEGWAFLIVDHFKPRSKGGSDEMDNPFTACVICNNMKQAYYWPTLEEARKNLLQWRDQMRAHWENRVQPLMT